MPPIVTSVGVSAADCFRQKKRHEMRRIADLSCKRRAEGKLPTSRSRPEKRI
jgi:hypothetical protein